MFTADVERVFPIDRNTMWSLWTDPNHLTQWMRPSLTDFGPTMATIDPQPGGKYRFEMINNSGEVHAAVGVFAEVEQSERLSFTWTWEGSGEETFVEVRLSDVPEGTKVHIVHTKLASQESATNHEQGWIGCLGSLAATY